MLTKTNFVFSITLISICFLFACQENDIIIDDNPPISESSVYAHMEGDFYTERIESYVYASGSTSFNNRDTADIGMTISVQNDTLMVLGHEFPIDSVDQTSFSRIWSDQYSNDPQELRVEYYNNYDSVKFYSSSGGYVNGTNVVTYRGTKGFNTKKRFNSNLYVLKVIHKEHLVAIDTQYTADLVVYFNGQTFEIGTSRLLYKPFCTYSREHRLSTGGYGSSKKLAYMENDSLYLDYYEIKYNNDTIYYSCQGVKK